MEKKPKNIQDGISSFTCGIFGWKPQFLQRCNNMTVFLLFYVLLCLIYGMSNSYISSVIPSIEKRFGFTSKKMGVILAMNDVTHILAALVTAHFGGNGNRPRWIMFGAITLGVALLLHAAPEILFPVRPLSSVGNIIDAEANEVVCMRTRHSSALDLHHNSTVSPERCIEEESNAGPMGVFISAQLLIGLGATTLMVLGLPFIDDNVQSKNTPMYFAVSFSGRIFGPVLGYGLGALCNSIFLDWSNPGFKQTDPRWISAWYLGFLFTGTGLCLFAATIGCFPASIPYKRKYTTKSGKVFYELEINKTSGQRAVTWQDLPRNVKRVLTNGAYVARTCGSILDGFFIAGYISFMPKFIGQQFQISPSAAAVAGGVPIVLATACAVVCGGYIIRRFKLEPRHVGLMLSTASLIVSVGIFTVIGFGCKNVEIEGLGAVVKTLNEKTIIPGACLDLNLCNCKDTDFNPVCDMVSGRNFYSPCYAGCEQFGSRNKSKTFEKCSCALPKSSSLQPEESLTGNNTSGSVIGGFCPKKCSNLYFYVGIMTLATFFGGLPLSGSIMIQFRVVDLDLKSMASGLSAMVMAALGFLPAPIVVGALVDTTCRLWQTKPCGEKGFCLLYNTDEFRWKLHVFAGVVKALACLLDLVVTYKVWNLKFDRGEDQNAPVIPISIVSPSTEGLPEGITDLTAVDIGHTDHDQNFDPETATDPHEMVNSRV